MAFSSPWHAHYPGENNRGGALIPGRCLGQHRSPRIIDKWPPISNRDEGVFDSGNAARGVSLIPGVGGGLVEGCSGALKSERKERRKSVQPQTTVSSATSERSDGGKLLPQLGSI